MTDWLYRHPTAFPNKKLHRLGLACNYGIDESGVRVAIERGVNAFLWTMKNKPFRAPSARPCTAAASRSPSSATAPSAGSAGASAKAPRTCSRSSRSIT